MTHSPPLYEGYSPSSQAVSELTSIGAPTRPALIAVEMVFSALLVAFGIGVWRSAHGNRALRITGGLLVAHGAIGPLWLPFPMTARGLIQDTTALTDVAHLMLAAVTVLLIAAQTGLGAAALGRGFRLYSILTLATVLAFGALTSADAPRIAAGEPTPWMGAFERINIGAWLLWVSVLAIILLSGRRRPG